MDPNKKDRLTIILISTLVTAIIIGGAAISAAGFFANRSLELQSYAKSLQQENLYLTNSLRRTQDSINDLKLAVAQANNRAEAERSSKAECLTNLQQAIKVASICPINCGHLNWPQLRDTLEVCQRCLTFAATVKEAAATVREALKK